MKYLRLLFLSILLPFCAFAQSNFKEGFVVKNTGDTLKGYIDYREWANTPKTITFKTAVNGKEALKWTPAMLKGFEVTGIDKYISYTGRISMDKNEFPDLPGSLDTTTAIDAVFLRYRYEGKYVSLLFHEDAVKWRMFVMETGKMPVELKYYQFYNGGSSIKAINDYRINLLALAQKYNSNNTKLQNFINNARFDQLDLTRTVKQINNDNTKSGGNNVRLFAGVALSRISTQFDGDNVFSGRPSVSYFPRISIGVDVFDNVYTKKLIFRGELSFSVNTPRIGLVETTPFTSSSVEYNTRFNQYNVAFTPQIIYNIYNKENFKIFLGGGVAFNFSQYSNNEVQRNDIVIPEYYKYKKLWLSFPLQAGVTIKKEDRIFAEYIHPTAYTQYTYFSVSNRVMNLGVHYLFK